jgi:hypothetical protein
MTIVVIAPGKWTHRADRRNAKVGILDRSRRRSSRKPGEPRTKESSIAPPGRVAAAAVADHIALESVSGGQAVVD